ncbi:MAG TPA: ATP-binding protein [Anaerolineales bacterium]
MTRSLRGRLLLAFVGVSLAGTFLALLLSARRTASEFGHFLADQNQESIALWLEEYYGETGGWAGVAQDFPERVVVPMMHGMSFRALPFALADMQRLVIVSGAGYVPGMELSPEEWNAWRPLVVDGRTVGAFTVRPVSMMGVGPAGESFLERTNQGLLLGAVGGTAMALLFAAVLARSLTGPLRELTLAAGAIARGDLGSKVNVRSQDEVGELAASFNHMSEELARTRDLRRQLSADLAHELRTPLSIILGHAEAIEDGVLPPNRETLSLIHDEAARLSRMVEDLRLLSLAEAGELRLQRAPTRPRAMLERAAAAQAPRARQKGIDLVWEADEVLAEVNVDPDRIAQVLDNLLDNALRHTPQGGRIRLRAEAGPVGPRFSVADSGPGIAQDDLPRVFERFYRTDPARSREQGGSGLGLAIAKSIVEAHGGRIWAGSPPGDGAVFTFEITA